MRLQEFPGAPFLLRSWGMRRKEGGGARSTRAEGHLAPRKENTNLASPYPPTPGTSAFCGEIAGPKSPDTLPFSPC